MKEKESIRTLKGVGEKTEKLFQKVGISTVGQLLRYYPRDYDIYREPVTVESLNDQETGAVLATLTSKSAESVCNLRNHCRCNRAMQGDLV